MPRICPKCGKEQKNNAQFCSACGAKLTDSAAESADDDVVIFSPQKKGEAGSHPLSFLKKVPKAVWVSVVIVALGAAALFVFGSVQSSLHSRDKTAAELQQAMEQGDFALLSKVARPSDESIAFTSETAQPMFLLYNTSSAFRRDVASIAEDGPSPFHLVPEHRFLYTSYSVMIDSVDLTVRTNIAGASITAGAQTADSVAQEAVVPALDGTTYTSDYTNLVRSSAKLSGLLPGMYDVTASYTASFGEQFQASSKVSLMESIETALNFEYASVYIWNTSDLDVTLNVGQTAYGTIGSNMTLQLAPLHPETVLTAECTTDAGEKMTSSVNASDSYFEIRFAVGKVQIYNDYDVNMDVAWAGDPYCSITGKSAYVIDSVPVGTKLTCSLEGYDIFKPYDYTVQYDYDSIYPILNLSDESSDKVALAISDYLTSLGPDAADPPTSLSADLERVLAETHLMSAALAISNITIHDVYSVDVTQTGVEIRLNGSYDYTLPAGITLPADPAVPAEPADGSDTGSDADTGASQDGTADATQPDADGTGTADNADGTQTDGSGDQPQTEENQTTFTQKFDAALSYDGTSWTVQG